MQLKEQQAEKGGGSACSAAQMRLLEVDPPNLKNGEPLMALDMDNLTPAVDIRQPRS